MNKVTLMSLCLKEDYNTINLTLENSLITSVLSKNPLYIQKAHFSTLKCLDKLVEGILLRPIIKKEKSVWSNKF